MSGSVPDHPGSDWYANREQERQRQMRLAEAKAVHDQERAEGHEALKNAEERQRFEQRQRART